MLHIIRTSTLLGQSIIAYLRQKGCSEVSVLRRNARVDWLKLDMQRLLYLLSKTTILAIECGNLEVAMETARSVDRPECWAQQALKQGNHSVSVFRPSLCICPGPLFA
jgi:coatomer protein complex subunit alpha (xenin)